MGGLYFAFQFFGLILKYSPRKCYNIFVGGECTCYRELCENPWKLTLKLPPIQTIYGIVRQFKTLPPCHVVTEKITPTILSRFFVVILHKNKKVLFSILRIAKNRQKKASPETPYFQWFPKSSDNLVNNLTEYAHFMHTLCKFCINPQTLYL